MNHVVCGGLSWSSKCEHAWYMTFAHGEVMKVCGWGRETPQNHAGIAELLTTAKQPADGEYGTPQLPVPHRVCWPCLEHTGHGEQKLWFNSIQEGQLLVGNRFLVGTSKQEET